MVRACRFAPIALAVIVAGCSTPGPPATQSLTPVEPSNTAPTATATQTAPDYRRLLLEPGDISSTGDQFTTRSVTVDPGGQDGVSTFFVNQDDTRAIEATVLVLPDEGAATAAKEAAISSAPALVTGNPEPIPVGDGGTMISGTAPDGSKAVTLVLFTQKRAVVKMEFGSATDDPTPASELTDIAQKQNIAIRTGLSE